MFKFADRHQHSIILADSLTKGFFEMDRTTVITRRGGTPQKLIQFLKANPASIAGYKIIIVHTGTNWLSGKEEWGFYIKLVNSVITKEMYEAKLKSLNPPPAVGTAQKFKETFQEFLDQIKSINKEATILVSSIIPRMWDHDRRHLV